MLQSQQRTEALLQNCQMYMDQIAASISQLQAHGSSEEMDCKACDSPDLDSPALQDSSSFWCCDVVVVNDPDSDDIVVANVIDDDDGEVIESNYVFVDNGSVGTCVVETKPKESLPLVAPLLEPEPKPLHGQENVTFTFPEPLGTPTLQGLYRLLDWIFQLVSLQHPG